MTTTAYIAVVGNGSWGGESVVHAADESAGEALGYRPGETRYRSLCGQKFLLTYGPTFAEVMPAARCRRCDAIVTKREIAR